MRYGLWPKPCDSWRKSCETELKPLRHENSNSAHQFVMLFFKRIPKYLPKPNQNQPGFLFSPKLLSTESSPRSDHVDSVVGEQFETWTDVVSATAKGGFTAELALFRASQMFHSSTKPGGYVLVHLVRASTNLGMVSYCQQLHSYILRSGFASDVPVSTALTNFYVKMGLLNDAHKVFVEIPEPSVQSWNSLISGHVRSGQFRAALCLFIQLDRSVTCADSFSFSSALASCRKASRLYLGESIHSKIVKSGVECSNVVSNCLIDMYGKCGSVEEAVRVFNYMTDKDTISWNSVIAACCRNKRLDLASHFLLEMPNPDTISYNELIDGFARFGDMEDALRILSTMPNPNSSSWNSVITGYVNRNRAREALDFFTVMHSNDVKMDQYTFSSILSGVAGLGALIWGMLIHCCTVKRGLATSVVVGTALINMYAKCGQMEDAESMFRLLPRRNLVTWNAMISGFAHNGDHAKAFHLFEELKEVGDVKPDDITFLNILSACSHDEVLMKTVNPCFESMVKEYRIEPTIEHCCSMIRLMGQRGEVRRAEGIIHDMGFEWCALVWRALLGACGACKDVKVAEIAAANVIKLKGLDEYVCVMMSNIYASYGGWRYVGTIRKLMREKGVSKEIGCSWIDVNNTNSFSVL